VATGLTDPALQVRQAVRPVLLALARGTPEINADDVEDLVSHVVERVLLRLVAGAKIEDLAAYSKKAARHAFYDRVGQRGVDDLAPKEDAAQGEGGVPWLERVAHRALSASPSDQLIAREDALRHKERITWAFQQLSVAERSILFLRHEECLDGEKIAELLGYKSAAVVDSLASRARTKLQRYLSPSLLGWALGR
jgi:RNA polymerase sigma factor (sigma-70 family)